MADFLVALADFDRRRGWADLGYSSLFYFLRRRLGLSKAAAQYRKTAAVLVQKFPETVEPFRDGRLCITSVGQLAKVLTPENRHEVLPQFYGRSRRESMALAAALNPKAAPRRDVVTQVRVPAAMLAAAPGSPSISRQGEDAVQPGERGAGQSVQPGEPESALAVHPAELLLEQPSLLPKPPRRDAAEPLTADLSRLHVTVSSRFLRKLEAARAALSHKRRFASAEEILEAGLDLLLQQHAKRKGLVEKPQKKSRPAGPQTLTAAVKREVWNRDGGCCAWPVESDGVCGSTDRVEFAHRRAKALGGPPTAENMWLLCRFHNDLDARQTFGDEWMDQFTGRANQEASGELIRDEPPQTSKPEGELDPAFMPDALEKPGVPRGPR